MTSKQYLTVLLLCLSCANASAACVAVASSDACAASEPARSAMHFRRDPPPASGSLLGPYEILGGLALAGAAGCWWRFRHQGRSPQLGSQDLRVINKCRLSAKSSVYVIRHGAREIMLAEGEHGITVIRDDAAV